MLKRKTRSITIHSWWVTSFMCCCCFFFSSRRRHTRFDCDWSSDVCSSDLHNARPGDLDDASFPPPAGRVSVELCAIGGKRSAGSCGQTLTEWLRPEEVPPVEDRKSVV